MKTNKTGLTLALYTDFEEAGYAIQDIKAAGIPGFQLDDITVKSPIEHPEITDMLARPVHVSKFTLAGVLLGPTTGLVLIASAQSTFIYQIRGGRPVVPLPPDMVLTYELFILSGVLMTVLGCLIAWKLPSSRSPLYNIRVSEDKVGVLVKAEPQWIPRINEILERHKPAEIVGDHTR